MIEYFIVFTYGRKNKTICSWPLLLVAIAWMLVALWELHVEKYTEGIRIDVFIVYPILFIISIVGFILSIGSLLASILRRGK